MLSIVPFFVLDFGGFGVMFLLAYYHYIVVFHIVNLSVLDAGHPDNTVLVVARFRLVRSRDYYCTTAGYGNKDQQE